MLGRWEGLEGTGLVVRFRGVGLGGRGVGRVGGLDGSSVGLENKNKNKNKDEDGGAESGA